jgi:hypothetical protein
MTWTGLLKSLSGLIIFLVLLVVGGVMGYQYLASQLMTPPAKPVFPNDNPTAATKAAPKPSAGASAPAAPKPETSPSLEPSPEASPKPADPANSYKAKVNFGDGLNVRESPTREGDRIAGVDNNEEVTVLETSTDGAWEKIRTADGTEGWVKAGYTTKLQ